VGTIVIPAGKLAYLKPPEHPITPVPAQALPELARQAFVTATAPGKSWETVKPEAVDPIRLFAAQTLGVRPETINLVARQDANGTAYLRIVPNVQVGMELGQVRLEEGRLEVTEERRESFPSVVRTTAELIPALEPAEAELFEDPRARAALEARLAERPAVLREDVGPKSLNFYAAMAVLRSDPRLGVVRVDSRETMRARGGPSISFEGNEVSAGDTILTLANGKTVTLSFNMEHFSHLTLRHFLYQTSEHGDAGFYEQLRKQGVRLP
jgi:hypothetical protein